MIKIVSDAAARWSHTAANLVWRRIRLLGFAGRRVRAAKDSGVWTVFQNGTDVFTGTKQQCEDWLDWQDQRLRKKTGRS